jgi:hypothetical protein
MNRFKKYYVGHSVAILGLLLFGVSSAHAFHPLVTDDAGTVGKGGVQLEINAEIAYDKENLDDSATVKSEAAEVAITLTYGLTENLDVAVTVPYQWLSAHQNDELIAREKGISDISLDLKWRFFQKDGWGVALKPGITLPTGNEEKGLGNGRATGRIFFITSKEIEPWAFHLNLGYIRNENKGEDRADLWHASAAAQVELVKDLKAVANIGIETNPASGSGTHPVFALGGLIYDLSEKISLDAGVKFGLTKPETDISYLAGVTIKF